MIKSIYNDVKIYQINLDFYEFAGIKTKYDDVINHIIDYHKANFKTDYEFSHSVEHLTNGLCNYTLYSFNESEKDSIWKNFFPDELIKNKDFTVKSTSFALFININARLFCIIGGKGISVITKFINHSFGLDFYEKLAEPENDIVYSHFSRGITGNLTSEQRTFRNEQKLQDILTIGKIPKKIFLILRTDLKDSIFDFIDFGKSENIYLEIGSSFCIKWKMSFEDLQDLIIKIDEIFDVKDSKSLSRFDKIQDEKFTKQHLLPALLNHLRDDMVRISNPNPNKYLLLDYDFVHPTKLNEFYGCDEYQVFLKGAQTPFYETRDRTTLYYSTLIHIYTLIEQTDAHAFAQMILGIRVRGYIGQQKKTEAMFINHLTCEINVTDRPYFFIDNHWYQVKGDFIESINNQCGQLIKTNITHPNPLDIVWNNEISEGDYNMKYLKRQNYYIFDKILSQNIELCDIIFETDDSLYIIHVKEGFDAKIRDLTNQVSMSANRLWNDLKSNLTFLKEIFENYCASSNNHFNLSWEDFIKKFTDKKIIFVMAFTTNLKNKTVLNHMDEHKSNIAKFSIIQSFREMNIENYQLQIIEIEKD